MDQLISFIIRPPRADYNPAHDLLDQEFVLKGKWFRRKDLEIKNIRGNVLQCSHYMPILSPDVKALPCVIYCHGNSGCRADASEAAIVLLPSNITVFTLDFSGSGLSGGEHVTLGWNEKDDLQTVVEYLRADQSVSTIGLWGRSMGAVTSLMYGAEDPSIAGMVLDSPFFDLVELMMELVDTYKFRLPRFTIKFAIQHMRRAIQKKAKFDIMELNTIKVARSCFVPVLLGHAIDDDFIQPHHSDRIYEAYMGDKNIIKFEGDHNSPRPQFYFDSINIFFHNVLKPPDDDVSCDFSDNHDYFGKIDVLGGTQTNSTEDAIAQLRSIRTLSRTEVPSASPSKDAPTEAKGEVGRDVFSSSSKMINLELSEGNSYDPYVLGSIEDDNYVEYTFEEVANFPCSEEEEQRMLMEAVAESLRELEMKEPNVGQHEDTHCASSIGLSNPCGEVLSSSHGSTLEMNLDETVSSHSSEDASTPKVSSGGASSSSNTTLNMESDADVDVSGCTRATLTVERSPKAHAKEGLFRRLDLGLFRK